MSEGERAGRRKRTRRGYKTKNKNPTRQCGEQQTIRGITPVDPSAKVCKRPQYPQKRIKSHLPGGALGAGRAAAECSLHHLDK